MFSSIEDISRIDLTLRAKAENAFIDNDYDLSINIALDLRNGQVDQ